MDALKDACKLSEPAFRKQLVAWMQTKEVNQRIQAKLRHDIIDCFSATALGREVTMRQQKMGHHMVPPASILALNTMVAEFLYTQNCQFTLSVFATEVPYPSALPDFESMNTSHPYRFRQDQLHDLLRSCAVREQTEDEVQSRYLNPSKDHTNTSLLFSLLETLSAAGPKERRMASMASKSTQCRASSRRRKKLKNMSKSMHQINIVIKQMVESITHITESMEHLPIAQSFHIAKNTLSKLRLQSQRSWDSKHPHSVVEAVQSLSNELETLIDRIQFRIGDQSQTVANSQQHPETIADSTMRYADWVQAIKGSAHGKRFLHHLVEHYKREQRLEVEQHKREMLESIKAERTRLKQMYKERFLNRLHGMMIGDSESAKGRFLSDVSQPDVPDRAQIEEKKGRLVTQQLNQLRLSTRKLPTIEIRPEVDGQELATNPQPAVVVSNHIAQQTRERAQHLVDQSDDIESSLRKRLQKHTLDTQTIVSHQQHIRQRSHFDIKLIAGVRCENTAPVPQSPPKPTTASLEVQCASNSPRLVDCEPPS